MQDTFVQGMYARLAKRFDIALPLLRAAYQRTPTPSCGYELACVLWECGDWQEAKSIARESGWPELEAIILPALSFERPADIGDTILAINGLSIDSPTAHAAVAQLYPMFAETMFPKDAFLIRHAWMKFVTAVLQKNRPHWYEKPKGGKGILFVGGVSNACKRMRGYVWKGHALVEPTSIEDAVKQIREANPEVLVYIGLGLNPVTLALSTMRLAPKQYALGSYPADCGSTELDAYILDEELVKTLKEPPRILAPIITHPDLDGVFPANLNPRTYENNEFYACPLPLEKYEWNDVIKFMKQEKGADFCFINRNPFVTQTVSDYLRGKGVTQFAFSEYLSSESFPKFLRASGAVLDSTLFSGHTTIVDALQAGCHVETWRGDTLQQNQGYATLQRCKKGALFGTPPEPFSLAWIS